MQAPSRREGPAPNGQLSSLPLDVLQRVASLMPLKDWARASGACRVMHTLQLDAIHVTPVPMFPFVVLQHEQERSAGLQWASKRWRCARSMRLEMTDQSSRELAAVLSCQQPEERPSSLHELSYMCRSSTATAPDLLPWLACFTPQLSVLLSQASSLLMRPPIAQLKHLVLTELRDDCLHVAEALPRLQGLQTLSLERACMSTKPLPALDLQGLGSLRQLNLTHVAAKRLALPEGCRMSVRTHSDDSTLMRDIDWASALPVLQSLHLAGYAPSQRPTLGELQACACLRDLRLHIDTALGREGGHCRLGGALARLETLAITAKEMWLAVPRDACWQAVKLHASYWLSVRFEDVRGSAAAIDAFSVRGPKDRTFGLAGFGRALTALGKGWASRALPRGAGDMTVMHSLQAWCAERCMLTGQAECMCGACLGCLHRAGVVCALQQPAEGDMPSLYPYNAPHAGAYSSDEDDEGFVHEEDWDDGYYGYE